MAKSMFFKLFLFLISCFPLSSHSSDNLKQGSSISVETAGDFLTSADGTFTAGFHPIGQNAYCFAIWFNKPSCSDNCTLVWMANRDHPVNGRQSKLSLLKSGNLILTDARDINIAWETNTVSKSTTHLKLYESGNLVLLDLEGAILWQSFDSPTDTLLPLQEFNKDSKLVSVRSQTNYSSGFYSLYFDTDNVLCLLYRGPELSSVYWPSPWLLRWEAGRSTYNDTRIALLDPLGNFSSTDDFTFKSADYGKRNIPRRLKLDFDGNIRLYSLDQRGETWVVSWQAFPQPCKVHGICGPNSLCTYLPDYGRKCSCISGYKLKNQTDWSFGCEPEFDVLPCNESEVSFLKFRHTEFYGYDYDMIQNYTLDQCKNLCLEICDCKGFQFRVKKAHHPYGGTFCYPKTQLRNGHREPNYIADFYVKLPKANLSIYTNSIQDYKLECSEQVKQLDRTYLKSSENPSIRFALWSACVIGGIEFLIIFLVWFFLIRSRHDHSAPNGGYHLALTASFRKFSYAELEKATRGFKKEIGRGSGGIVYKGILSDTRVAAIKCLVDANQGEAEFLAEVNTIGKLNHMNLIDLWGYCAEGKRKLLVYEYIEKGSLAENLSSKTLDWKKRYEIAFGTAKGLAYLHEECLEWILHCDIKPENILIDSNFQPKVSDFGLSWLLNRNEVNHSRISKIRGTRGYMAPEWIFNMPITSKVDVYSYGIVLLELVTGRSPSMVIHGRNGQKEETEQGNLVEWVKEKMSMEGVGVGGIESETQMEGMIDPTLIGKFEKDEMLVLVTVALKCVQEDKDARPTMGQFYHTELSSSVLICPAGISSIYWPNPSLLDYQQGRSRYNDSRIAVFDTSGNFTSSDKLRFQSADFGKGPWRRLTLDFDGNLRLYAFDEEKGIWAVKWQAISSPCKIHGICGPYSICHYDPALGPRCSCLPGYEMKNMMDWSYGCKTKFKPSCENQELRFVKLRHVKFPGYNRQILSNCTLNKCIEKCLNLCCQGFQYPFFNKDSVYRCYLKNKLRNGCLSPDIDGILYLRLPKSEAMALHNQSVEGNFHLNCSSNIEPKQLHRAYHKKVRNHQLTFKILLCFASILAFVETVLVLRCLYVIRQRSYRRRQGYVDVVFGMEFKRFTYHELKKATRSFSEEIGRGGGGVVYKGLLSDQRITAIKRLNLADKGEEEFLAEISTIGRLNHMNLIEMWGYCAEGKHRLLVYEYMENGSLAMNLIMSSTSLDWNKRFEIAVGTAKRDIIHKNSSFSKVRGTRGYMAPEWIYNQPITSKVDIYSYGVVVLEMLTGRSPTFGGIETNNGDAEEQQSLVEWVKEKKNRAGENDSWVEELVGEAIGREYDRNKVKILLEVAIKCTEIDRDARPTMSQVLQMLGDQT
ncbi:hypothetical protein CCACVL1_14065 [Corchorus capsularis]|uniref:non-specific serine/threonine protein kinase n=1 Tax=Corchorus capsularis TaxID=210143 RepID=A0A1R3I8B4_COCAP|nr:hypothetical protein CCACVL1_14065 [Corchorus capsularis]